MTTDTTELRDSFKARILDETKKTIQAFCDLVEQSNVLADAMGYRRGYVLMKVLPKSGASREDPSRIRDWMEKELDECLDSLVAIEIERLKGDEREALISSLQLTDEQKAILGLCKTSLPS